MKKLIVFDLDETLAQSKEELDTEMAALLSELLKVTKVSVISGGGWPQFQTQVLAQLPQGSHLSQLQLLPTCGTQFYQYTRDESSSDPNKDDWTQLYAEDFTDAEKAKITKSLEQSVASSGFTAEKCWGEQIEDRSSQITFSALEQHAQIDENKKWDPDFKKRQKIKTLLVKPISEFAVNLGGATSIDVTKPGIDKGYGIRKLRDTLGIAISDMIFVGDAISPGGNDYPAKQAGATSICVGDSTETKRVSKPSSPV